MTPEEALAKALGKVERRWPGEWPNWPQADMAEAILAFSPRPRLRTPESTVIDFAPIEAAALDVERLARAEHNRRVSVEAECHHGRAGNDCDIVARWDAREYARLAAEEDAG